MVGMIGVMCMTLSGCGESDDRSADPVKAAENHDDEGTVVVDATDHASPLEEIVDDSADRFSASVAATFRGLDTSPIPMPKRPASSLKAVTSDEAWKTPLNLSRFHAEQFQGKKRISRIADTVAGLIEAGEFQQAAELALLLPNEGIDSLLLRIVRMAAGEDEAADPEWLLKVSRWIGEPESRSLATSKVAQILARAGKRSEASEAIREARVLIKDDPGIGALISVATAQQAMDDKQLALSATQLASQLIRAKKSAIMYGQSLIGIGRVLVRAGELERVKFLTGPEDSLWNKTVAADQRADLAVMMAEEGELKAALAWIARFPAGDTPAKQKRQEAYAKIAIGLVKQGDLEKAKRVMSLSVQEFRLSFMSSRYKSEMAIALAETGKIEDAVSISRQRGCGSKSVLLAISDAQWEGGQEEEARETLRRADKAGGEFGGFFTKKHQELQTLAIAYAKTGLREPAAETLRSAVEAANEYKKSEGARRSKESVVTERLLEMLPTAVIVADQELTDDILERAIRMARNASMLHLAAVKLVETGFHELAMELVGQMEGPDKKRTAIRSMARSLTRVADPESFRRFVGPGQTRPLKRDFTPDEQRFAKQLVTALSAD